MELLTFESLFALLTLSVMEIVLGIDNIVMLSIMTNKLPHHQRNKGRKLGLTLAMMMRIGLLCSLSWVMSMTTPLFSLFNVDFTGRSFILLIGGAFLIAKATHEIHEQFDPHEKISQAKQKISFISVLVQVAILDIIFSLDSVITAVGMVNNLLIMVAAIIIAIMIMIYFSKYVSEFIEKNPSIKILALSFLILIGFMLIIEGVGKHVDKGYIYFAIGFSLSVEMLNIRRQNKVSRIAK